MNRLSNQNGLVACEYTIALTQSNTLLNIYFACMQNANTIGSVHFDHPKNTKYAKLPSKSTKVIRYQYPVSTFVKLRLLLNLKMLNLDDIFEN